MQKAKLPNNLVRYDNLPSLSTLNMIPISPKSSPLIDQNQTKQQTLPIIPHFDLKFNSLGISVSSQNILNKSKGKSKVAILQNSMKLSRVNMELTQADNQRTVSTNQTRQMSSPKFGINGSSYHKIENNYQVNFRPLPEIDQQIIFKQSSSHKIQAHSSIRIKQNLTKTKIPQENIFANENSADIQSMMSLKLIKYQKNNQESIQASRVEVSRLENNPLMDGLSLLKIRLKKIRNKLKLAKMQVNTLKKEFNSFSLQDYKQIIDSVYSEHVQIYNDKNEIMSQTIEQIFTKNLSLLKQKVLLHKTEKDMLNIVNQQLGEQDDKNYLRICQILETE